MKKLLALAILSTVSLAKPCFGVDFTEDEIFYTATTYGSNSLLGCAYAVGYHYTNNTKISIGPIVSFSLSDLAKHGEMKMGILAGLDYNHKIDGTSIAPYITAKIGILSSASSDYNFAYRASSGARFPLSSQTNFSVGYYLEKGLSELGYLYGPELVIDFNF